MFSKSFTILSFVERLFIKVGLRRSYSQFNLELLRILMGVLGAGYFSWLLRDFSNFTSHHGLIDHKLSHEIFWFTRLSIFQNFLPEYIHFTILIIAVLLCLLIVVGFYVRWAALVLYVISFSVQRWNFQVIFVDDLMVTFIFFWLIFLPVGRRDLSLQELKNTRTESLILDIFILNIFIAYVAAGLSKLSSHFWLSGQAVEIILKTPISRFSEFDITNLRPLLRLFTYGNLVAEPLIPFLIFQNKFRLLKIAGLVSQFFFHFFIILTMGIPFANLLLFSSSLLLFNSQQTKNILPQTKLTLIPLVYILFVFLSSLQRVPYMQPIVNASFVAKYLMGNVQNYNLFDWIDERNFQVHFKLQKKQGEERQTLDVTQYLPRETRFTVLSFSLVHQRWLPFAEDDQINKMYCTITKRLAARMCKNENLLPTESLVVSRFVNRMKYAGDTPHSPLFFKMFEVTCSNHGVLNLDLVDNCNANNNGNNNNTNAPGEGG